MQAFFLREAKNLMLFRTKPKASTSGENVTQVFKTIDTAQAQTFPFFGLCHRLTDFLSYHQPPIQNYRF